MAYNGPLLFPYSFSGGFQPWAGANYGQGQQAPGAWAWPNQQLVGGAPAPGTYGYGGQLQAPGGMPPGSITSQYAFGGMPNGGQLQGGALMAYGGAPGSGGDGVPPGLNLNAPGYPTGAPGQVPPGAIPQGAFDAGVTQAQVAAAPVPGLGGGAGEVPAVPVTASTGIQPPKAPTDPTAGAPGTGTNYLGWANMGVGAVNALGSLYVGYKAMQNAADAYSFNKNLANRNLANQTKAYNDNVSNRIRGMYGDSYISSHPEIQKQIKDQQLNGSSV